MFLDLGITSYLFGKIADFSWNQFYDSLGLQEKADKKSLKKIIEDYRDYMIDRHKDNPYFEEVLRFWETNHIVEEILMIEYHLESKFATYDDFKNALEDQYPQTFNKSFSISLMDELDKKLIDLVRKMSQFSQSDTAVYANIVNTSNKVSNSEILSSISEILSSIEELSKQFQEFVFKNNIKHDTQLAYIRKSKIENFVFIPSDISKMSLTSRYDYKYNYYLFQSFEFEGDFGDNPTVFLIYSEDDNKIELNTSSHGLQPENLRVLKFKTKENEDDKYKYNISREYCYYSNKESEYDIRPFIVIVLGDDVMGFATLTVINKSFKKGQNFILPLTGHNQFVPKGRVLIWPNKKDLLKKFHEPQTGKVFFLDDSAVDEVIKIKNYFLNSLKDEVKNALKQVYE
ncbi:hypothetical protein A6J84_002375 [Streptococcus sp. FDAARGOS_256]|jgi:hypothetical protein|uniref:hypothetical protein n=1 Tax=Streptococcus TaxID=1301 RepID=UPI000BAE378A|nr:hypothetical protein [Streptococcus sp. FDAARGOS_256]PNK71179.1 hypothetical protein A6J84_002375 [Streptococcus sp. FDAARGOS_256]